MASWSPCNDMTKGPASLQAYLCKRSADVSYLAASYLARLSELQNRKEEQANQRVGTKTVPGLSSKDGPQISSSAGPSNVMVRLCSCLCSSADVRTAVVPITSSWWC